MAVYTGKYYYASGCVGGPQPGGTGSMAWYTEAYASQGGSSMGIYNCRGSTGGSGTSVHSEGRAMDFGTPISAEWGTTLSRALRAMSKELGIQLIIWNREQWLCTRPDEWTPYLDGDPHTNHLHVEMIPEFAAKDKNEIKKLWTDVMNGEIPSETSSSDSDESSSSKSKSSSNDSGGIVKEEDLTGMDSFKEREKWRGELEGQGSTIEDAVIDDLRDDEIVSVRRLQQDMADGKKTTTDYLSSGVSAIGYAGMIYSVLLFFAFIFDTSNNFVEGSVVKGMTGGKLETVYDKDDVGKSGGTTKISWGGAIKYSSIGLVVSLLLLSGVAFGWYESIHYFIQDMINGDL